MLLLIRPVWGTMGRQLKSAYQEWRRDRPVEATTTYRRRVGKVPSPGRFSCTIRELSSRPFRAGRVFPCSVPSSDAHAYAAPRETRRDQEP